MSGLQFPEAGAELGGLIVGEVLLLVELGVARPTHGERDPNPLGRN